MHRKRKVHGAEILARTTGSGNIGHGRRKTDSQMCFSYRKTEPTAHLARAWGDVPLPTWTEPHEPALSGWSRTKGSLRRSLWTPIDQGLGGLPSPTLDPQPLDEDRKLPDLMARPKKEKHERRTASTRTDLTVAEKEYLREQAALAGMTEAEYVRRRILGHQVSPAPRQVDAVLMAALINEVNRLGVNVNQLARAANTDRTPRMDWRDVAAECERVLAKVARAYGS